jgi:hypothetical protein
MKEICIIPTYRRDPLLYVCLKRLRQVYKGTVLVGSDKGHFTDELTTMVKEWDAELRVLGHHERHGNTFNAGELLRFAYDAQFDLVHYLEDDAFVNDRWYDWTIKVHDNERIFCSGGWVCNREMPFVDFTYFAPWIYIPQFSIKRDRLASIVKHLKFEYYADMRRYIGNQFPKTPLKKTSSAAVSHYEIDGLIQHIISDNQECQVAWNARPTVMHMGFAGYNRGGYATFDGFFSDCKTFASRVAKIEKLADDPYWRASLFGGHLVANETGPLIPRVFHYEVELPGGWSSRFDSELEQSTLPSVINSTRIPHDAKITLIGRTG